MILLNTVGRIFVGSFRQRCSILLVPIVLLLGASLFAQSPTDPQQLNVPEEDSSFRHFRFGLSGGLNIAHHTTGTFTSSCTDFTNADATNFAVVGSFETLVVPDLSLWFSSRLRLIDYSARFASSPVTFNSDKLESGKRITVISKTQQFFQTSLTGIGFSPGAKWQIVPGFSLGVDPSLILLLSGNSSQVEEFIEPLEGRFIVNDERSRSMDATATPPRFSPFAVDLGASASFLLPLNETLSLSIDGRLSTLLTSLSSDVDWKGWSGLVTLGIAYGDAPVARAKDTLWPLMAPPLIQIQKKPVLSATITARGVDEKGATYENPEIEIEEAPWTESSPVIPFIFFNQGSAGLPARYVQLSNSAQVERFSVDSMLYVTPMDMHWQLLNIIGMRLRDNPTVTMTISGRTSGDETDAAKLAADRAGSVREYLVNVWNIDAGRITISDVNAIPPASEATEDGREENRRAELSFSSDVITRPVVVERVARIASPPSIRFYPEFVADTLIDQWTITIFQGDKELVRFEGSNQKESGRVWLLSDTRVNRDLSRISYRLDVRDVLGTTASAEGSFEVTERVTRVNDSLVRRFQIQEFDIVGFNYDSPELLDRHHQDLIEAARAISPDAHVQITGYTDRVGELEHNRQLALNRAEVARRNLVEILRSEGRPVPDDMTAQGSAGESEPFNNNLPEGRILSRMVKVLISRAHRK